MILIVDDKRENILPLQKILQLHSLECDSAESGEEALRKILKTDYSLIILDVQMPGMDGFEVAETLAGSNRTKDIPVIFLSAISKEKKYISKGYQSGGVDYITKPVDPDLLILKVKTFLKLHQQQQELKAVRDLLSKEIDIRKEAQENLEMKVDQRTRELKSKNEELELRNHELQQFAWVVSHDLKEPIRKIEIFTGLIKERHLVESADALHCADRTLAAADRMGNLINDLLDYSRLSATVAHKPVGLNLVVRDVLEDLSHRIQEKNATVNVKELPIVPGITSQLRQVFQNLLGNALKFSRNGVAPKIDIHSELICEKAFDGAPDENGPYCRITVKDNGIGFEEKYLDRIFVIFQSLNPRDSYEGTGIGLAIAKKIIEKHDGLITARSAPDEGAEFVVVLPVAQNSKTKNT